jgi:glycosyltransferase involved in cell wall biosynthesis
LRAGRDGDDVVRRHGRPNPVLPLYPTPRCPTTAQIRQERHQTALETAESERDLSLVISPSRSTGPGRSQALLSPLRRSAAGFHLQRSTQALPHANFVATVHHGVPADLHRPSFEPGSYVAFLGRISPEKRPDRAIRIALAAGIPLKIAAKVDKVDEDYFRTEILPLIDGPGIEFIGEINEREKTKFLGEAAASIAMRPSAVSSMES